MLLLSPSLAQIGAIEPQDLGVLLYREKDNFAPLELRTALKQKSSPMFSLSSQEFLSVSGALSPVRFKTSDGIKFYLRLLTTRDPRAVFLPSRDPTKFSLVRWEVVDSQRRLTLVKTEWSESHYELGSPLLVRLYGEQSFQLSPSQQTLEPGEYAVVYLRHDGPEENAELDLFCFGIDP